MLPSDDQDVEHASAALNDDRACTVAEAARGIQIPQEDDHGSRAQAQTVGRRTLEVKGIEELDWVEAVVCLSTPSNNVEAGVGLDAP